MGRLDVRQVQEKTLDEAKRQAAELKASIAKLSNMEKSVGAKYLAPVTKLIQAVEAI